MVGILSPIWRGMSIKFKKNRVSHFLVISTYTNYNKKSPKPQPFLKKSKSKTLKITNKKYILHKYITILKSFNQKGTAVKSTAMSPLTIVGRQQN